MTRAAQQSADRITREADDALLALEPALRERRRVNDAGLNYASVRGAHMRSSDEVVGRQGALLEASVLVAQWLPDLRGTKPERVANAIKRGDLADDVYRHALEGMREVVAAHYDEAGIDVEEYAQPEAVAANTVAPKGTPEQVAKWRAAARKAVETKRARAAGLAPVASIVRSATPEQIEKWRAAARKAVQTRRARALALEVAS